MRKNTILALVVTLAFLMGQQCAPDTDVDGVPDATDTCPNTPLCADVDANGCPSDTDGDGVANGCDQCPDTPAGDTVYASGCSVQGDGGGVPSRCPGPDPRAKEIEYSLVNLTGDTTAQILIKGRADNLGLADYVSAPGQQSLQLWEDDTMVAEQPFQDLAVDAIVTVEYERSWSLSGGGAQPARYKLLVTYDPDIRYDDNPNNDDCREANNMILRGTGDISSLFD